MQTNKRKLFLIYSPLTVIVIMGLFYAFYGIFPFGTKTAAWCDLNQQTIPLLMNLKDILDGKSNILFTAESGGGMNFWGVFFFFLASPFYLAVKFIPKQDISYFVTVLLVLKMALCSFTASLYFSVTFKKINRIYIILFGLMYAFCGYILMYYQTLVWLDIVYLFPLLVMSADHLCENNNCIFFIAVLSAVAAVNYYLSYMIAVYLLIAVPLYIFFRCDKDKRKAVSCRFILSSLTAALITAPVWLCSFIQTGKSARGSSNIIKFIFESPFESLRDKLCIVITNAFLFAVLLLLIKNPVSCKKRIKSNLILLLLLMIPVFLDPINKIWHFGGYQSFPLRFGYMITFTMLVIACDVFEDLPQGRKSSVSYYILSFSVLAVFTVTAILVTVNKKAVLSYYYSYLGISDSFFRTLFIIFIFAFSLYMLYFILLKKKLISNKLFFTLISGVFMIETFVNVSTYIGNSSNNDTLFGSTMTIESSGMENNNFYRVKNEKKYFHANMTGALGLNSYAHYTSLNPEKYLYAMKKLGYSSYWMETGSNDGTVLTDALLGIKYSIGYDSDFSSYQKNLNIDSSFAAAENLICAPAGIITDTLPEKCAELKYTDRFDIQRQFASNYFGTDEMLEKYDYAAITGGAYQFSDGIYKISADNPDRSRCRLFYSMKIKGHKILYLDLFDSLGNNVTEPFYNSLRVTVNGTAVNKSYPDKKSNGFLKLGEFENEDVDITLTLLKDISVKSFSVFSIDTDQLKNEINKLTTTEPVLNGSSISAQCNANSDNEYLYLSIPYDKGFTAYLNSRKVKIYNVNDCFCAIKLDKGKNDIKIIFRPEGFNISLFISAAGLLLLAFIKLKGSIIFNSKTAGMISEIICRYAFLTVIIVVYFVPVIAYLTGLIIRFGV